VTVVDAETAAVVEKIGAGGRALALLGGPTVVVLGPALHLIDAARHAKVAELRLAGLRGLVTAPDGAFAVALAERTVLVLDGATGKERARFTDFVDPAGVDFGPPPRPRDRPLPERPPSE
jgi:hypothetical protein